MRMKDFLLSGTEPKKVQVMYDLPLTFVSLMTSLQSCCLDNSTGTVIKIQKKVAIEELKAISLFLMFCNVLFVAINRTFRFYRPPLGASLRVFQDLKEERSSRVGVVNRPP